MTDKMLRSIEKAYPLEELPAGEFSDLKLNGMRFSIHSYRAQGLGTVSVMKAKGFFGLMKMDTLILNPSVRDMPLMSYDRIHAMGNDTLIIELFDTFLQKTELPELELAQSSGASLPDHDPGSHWYDPIKLPVSVAKKGRRGESTAMDLLAEAYADGFLKDSRFAAACDPQRKREKAAVYVEGLLSHGGPATDVFRKALGKEKTAELFRKVLFATEDA